MAKQLTLAEIIDKLEATGDVDKITDQHENARETYVASKGIKKRKATTMSDFRQAGIDYLKHHHKSVYGTELPDHMAAAQLRQLAEIYARQRRMEPEEGLDELFKMAKKGKLNDVLDYLKGQIRDTELVNRDEHIIEGSVDANNIFHQTALVREYMEAYENLLTPDMKSSLAKASKKPEHLAASYKNILRHHRSATKQYKADMQTEPEAKRRSA
jgi:hypothetical protein